MVSSGFSSPPLGKPPTETGWAAPIVVAGAVAHVSQRTRPDNALFMRLVLRAALRCARSSSFHRLKLDPQLFHFWLHDFFVITITDFDRVRVRARLEHDVFLLGQILVYIGRQTI